MIANDPASPTTGRGIPRWAIVLAIVAGGVLLTNAVVAVVSLAIVADGSAPTVPSTVAPPAEAQSAQPAAEQITDVTIDVAGGQVSPAPTRVRIDRGDKVPVSVTSDVADKVHLHGYDIEKPVTPDKPAVIAFTADQAGLFELETHEAPVLILAQLQIQ